MALTGSQKRYLRGAAHHLDPVVLVGQHGITDAVSAKITTELEHHELLKIKVSRDAPVKAKPAATALAEATGSEVVQVIGHMVVLWKQRKKESAFTLP